MRAAPFAAFVLCGCRIGFEARLAGDGAIAKDALADVRGDGPAICHTGTWSAPQLLAATANSSEDDDPSISDDELTLYFTSNRTPSMGRAIWVTTRASRTEPFGAPVLVGELDSNTDDVEPSITADGLTLYFTSGRNLMIEIFVATRASTTEPFGTPQVLAIAGDTTTARGSPRITRDQLGLYYSRGGLQVAYASRPTTSDPFTFVRELDEINANQTDGGATITPDGLELLFDSYRNGPSAIFVATRADTQSVFSGPTELSALPMVAGGQSAGHPDITPDGRTLYYFISTDQIDLYTVTRDCN